MMGYNSKNCVACGAALYGKHSHAKFCGDRCRKRWARRKEHVRRETYDAMYHIGQLRRLLKEYPDLRPDINERLRLLRDECTSVLLLHDPKTQQENAERNELLIGLMRPR
jgi:predicted nucleic acid-binding Zn ribbon protein